MATHSSILAWRISWREEPGRLQSMGSHRTGHDWSDWRESEWTPGVGDGQGGLACCDSWGCKESDMTERLNWTEVTKQQQRQCISVSHNLPIYPSLPLSPGNHKFVFYICHSYFSFVGNFTCTLFSNSTYKWYRMILVFLCLTDFTYDNL